MGLKAREEIADETEFARRRNMVGCTVRYLDGGTVILQVNAFEVATKTEITFRGKVKSVSYFFPSLDKLNAHLALPAAK